MWGSVKDILALFDDGNDLDAALTKVGTICDA
jgi:hypothetical protein